jgi:hypothetical protein
MPGNPRRRAAVAVTASLLLAGAAVSCAVASSAEAATVPAAAAVSAAPGTRTVTLPNGSIFSWNTAGDATVTSKSGAAKTVAMPRSAGRGGLGETYGPTQSELVTRAQDTQFELGSKSAPAGSALTAPMNTGPVTLPQATEKAARRDAVQAPAPAPTSGIPANDALSSSFDSYLNAQGVDAVGTFADDAKYLHALPGAGEVVTNVSIGDLTDQSMADNGDLYVEENGPTTIIRGGQRYLDIPTMPLIPTYVADSDGTLDPTGSTENQDPSLGEVLLDFSMMAPLPDGDQRSGATGSGLDDLLGIAPGASYRLVVPQDATYTGINTALWAAANQQPRPSVITASLGFGTDEQTGFPGRYLEDDPTIEATLAKIVKMGIPVVVSANDGTRLILPVSVGPDGGATPTNAIRDPNAQTDINDDEPTTIPSELVDDGVIAAGATTTDDTLASPDISTGSYPATRYDGSANYASGFGSRIDLSAPGDDLPSFYRQSGFGVSPQTVQVVLNGGTSAAAPQIAAAIADVLQAAKATGTQLTPAQVRQILVETGRQVAQTPQADQSLNVGPQLDVTKAVEKVLSRKYPVSTGVVRMSVAERQVLPATSGIAFTEGTNPAAIDLSGPADADGQPSGQNAVSPITVGLDMTGARPGTSYRLQIGGHTIYSPVPYVRLLPSQILTDSGLPLTSTNDDRSVTVTMQAVYGGRIVGQQSQALTFLADDGTYEQAQAPALPGKAALGQPVTVSYDLTNVRNVSDPRLVLSSVGHYTPSAGVDLFNVAWSAPLTSLKGTVTIPASAFEAGGGGLYGVGIQTNSVPGRGGSTPVYGDFRAITVGPPASERAGVVTLDGRSHAVSVTRADSSLTVSWDVRDVPGATGAELEVGAPAPTLFGSLNTVTNQNGTKPDDDGFNHPYTLVKTLSGVAGRETISLSGLRLPTSLQYPVRVIALRGRQTTGQASPTSFLQYVDGDQVAGTVEGISVSGGKALIATDTFGGDQGLTLEDSATIPYDLATGSAGPDLTDDTSGQSLGDVIGTDRGTGNTLILRQSYASGEPEIQLINSSGTTVAETGLSQLSGITQGASYLESAVLDPQRHVAYVEVYDSAQGVSQLFTLNMATGAVTGPIAINPDNAGRTFSNLSVDESTGDVFAATTGTQGPCLDGVYYGMVKIDPSTGTVSPAASLPACVAGVAPDGQGGQLYVADGPATPSFESDDFPASEFFTVNQSTLTPSAAQSVGTHGPAWPTYDPVNKVVVEASIYEENIATDNNAMSEITVIDAGTGTVLERLPVANIIDSTEADTNFDFTSHQGLFLDPATRTGWLEDAWGTGLEQFHY